MLRLKSNPLQVVHKQTKSPWRYCVKFLWRALSWQLFFTTTDWRRQNRKRHKDRSLLLGEEQQSQTTESEACLFSRPRCAKVTLKVIPCTTHPNQTVTLPCRYPLPEETARKAAWYMQKRQLGSHYQRLQQICMGLWNIRCIQSIRTLPCKWNHSVVKRKRRSSKWF